MAIIYSCIGNTIGILTDNLLVAACVLSCVEFVFAPQHRTSCDSEITTNEDFDN